MKKLLLFCILTIMSITCVSQKIYVTRNKHEADFLVYVEKNQFASNLWVFETKYKFEVTKNIWSGIWFYTFNRYDADYKIFFTDNKNEAQIAITYVNNMYIAGSKFK
jgi:hypothetical protein